MHVTAEILKYREYNGGTDLIIRMPNRIDDIVISKRIRSIEVRFDDGRHISADQRRKAYATIRDIADHTGYLPEEQKEWLKYLYMIRTGNAYISLSDCSMDEAREFINCIMEYALEEGIALSEAGTDRTDDIDRYLWCCLRYRKCAICGRPGEIHHVDAIGMGRDRQKVDDSKHKKICLCRMHHMISHQRGQDAFERMYHVHGILYDDASP